MDRRSFFRSLIGAAPAAAAAPPAAAPSLTPPALHRGAIPACRCGLILRRWSGTPRSPVPIEEFYWCENRTCELFHQPFAAPWVALDRADPELVKRVIADANPANFQPRSLQPRSLWQVYSWEISEWQGWGAYTTT